MAHGMDQGLSDNSGSGICWGWKPFSYLHGWPAGVPRVVNGEPGEGGRWARCNVWDPEDRVARADVRDGGEAASGTGWRTGMGE